MVEQSLDRVAFGFITSDRSNRDDERLGSAKDKPNKVAMALGGAIAGYCMTELSGITVWTAVVVDVDEVEADDPRGGRGSSPLAERGGR